MSLWVIEFRFSIAGSKEWQPNDSLVFKSQEFAERVIEKRRIAYQGTEYRIAEYVRKDLAQRQQREAGADGNPETSAPAKEGA